MEPNNLLTMLKKKRGTIITIVFVFFMLALLLSLAQTMKYTVKSRLLVIQDTATSDAYALSKSNEYLGSLFAEVVYSSSFYDQVMNSNYSIGESYFSGNYSQQIKKWQSTVKTKTQGNTGIIEIYIYHPQVSEAKKIALAVNDILMNKNQAYQGGQGVKINIIDQPIASSYPNKPDLVRNLAMAIFGALIVSLFYIYIFPEDKYDLYIIPGKRHRHQKISQDILRNYQAQPNNNPTINHQNSLNEQVADINTKDQNFNRPSYSESVSGLVNAEKKPENQEEKHDKIQTLKGDISNIIGKI